MSSIFINRNRTQGQYGQTIDASNHPLRITKFESTGDIWKARTKVPENNQFYKTSLKYKSNYDLKDDRLPGTSWALVDSCDAVRRIASPKIFVDENQNGKWKQYDNFEKRDSKFRKKEILKDEIQNIAMRIVKAREA